ncbi:MAG TPA: hypothetical protein VFS33_04225 [Gemmatimonadales bacterium]|nr:hypothetical protein [Gemmatimonadales bacterium]
MTLLEVLVALVVVTTAGVSLVAALANAVRTEQRAEATERTTQDAHRLLAALALLSATDLDRRLGSRQVGAFVVEVQRPEPGLYRIALAEVSAPELELLVTVVHPTDGVGR